VESTEVYWWKVLLSDGICMLVLST